MALARDVALFLDVDLTLTAEHVQATYARLLGLFDEYRRLEVELDEDRIDSRQFGLSMVRLLADKSFTKDDAIKYYTYVQQQPWCPLIRSLDVDLFLVSAGPSYFVTRLATEWSIPPNRILCSDYDFRDDTGIVNACSGVTAEDKAKFVRRFTSSYRVTVGIGDSIRSDGPFLSLCTLSYIIPLQTISSLSIISQLRTLMKQAGVTCPP